MQERKEDITDNDAQILVALALSRAVPADEGLEALRQIIQRPPETVRVKEIVAAETLERLTEDELPRWVKDFVSEVSVDS